MRASQLCVQLQGWKSWHLQRLGLERWGGSRSQLLVLCNAHRWPSWQHHVRAPGPAFFLRASRSQRLPLPASSPACCVRILLHIGSWKKDGLFFCYRGVVPCHIMPWFSLALTNPAARRVNLPAAVDESTSTDSEVKKVKVRCGLCKCCFRHQERRRCTKPPAPLRESPCPLPSSPHVEG